MKAESFSASRCSLQEVLEAVLPAEEKRYQLENWVCEGRTSSLWNCWMTCPRDPSLRKGRGGNEAQGSQCTRGVWWGGSLGGLHALSDLAPRISFRSPHIDPELRTELRASTGCQLWDFRISDPVSIFEHLSHHLFFQDKSRAAAFSWLHTFFFHCKYLNSKIPQKVAQSTYS